MIKNKKKEARKQKRLERLGSNYPVCVTCGEDDDRCHEGHHIAGRAHDDAIALLCCNCHRKVTDDQKDHPKPAAPAASRTQSTGYLLLGLANLFGLLVVTLRQHGEYLIKAAKERKK
jgi:hypothetical protein